MDCASERPYLTSPLKYIMPDTMIADADLDLWTSNLEHSFRYRGSQKSSWQECDGPFILVAGQVAARAQRLP